MSLSTFHIPTEKISGDTAILEGEELRHARLTLRLGPGEEARILDGKGTSYRAEFISVEKERALLRITSRSRETDPSFRLTIAMGIVPGDRYDWAVQKGTELGARAFIPLVTERTEVRLKGKWKRLERLQRVVVAACKQCGRASFPAISEPVALENLDIGGFDLTVVFWEGKTVPPLKTVARDRNPPASCLMVIGPVGGLTAAEAALLKERGAHLAGMGPRILRTETAVAAGATLLQFLWGDMG